ncbi:MAG: beta-ketoacyl-[acyl-carrier-protein] synthase family protein [Planctomycetota bacterium]
MPEASDRPVITGLGAVTPIGLSFPAFTAALRRGVSGTHALPPDSRCESTAAATVGLPVERDGSEPSHPGAAFDPASVLSASELKRVPRLVPMALAAANEALAHAGLGPEDRAGMGLILGTGGGGIDFTLTQADRVHHDRPPSLWTITNATHGNLAGELSIALGLRGPSLCVSTGCASSIDALGHAADLLRSDRAGAPDAMLVVGADAHVRWETLKGMELLGVISKRKHGDHASAHTASRPFDATRDGFVLGEGAWAVVLERTERCVQRRGLPLAELLGYGATCDAHHRVRPDPEPAEASRAMLDAMRDAALEPGDIGLVHAHGTATPINDALETAAIRHAFGEHADRLRITSVKSMIGHPQGASGLAAVAATLAGLLADDPFVSPTINLNEPDPACDLGYTPHEAVAAEADVAMINCLAFGAKNSAVLVRARRA